MEAAKCHEPSQVWKAGWALGAATSLASCGGEDAPPGKTSVTPAPITTQATLPLSDTARFLAQATNGTDFAMIEKVSKQGFESWLNAQFSTARSGTYWDWLERNGYADESHLFSQGSWEIALWYSLFHDNDLLRQRMTLALLDIFVVGIGTLHPGWRSFSMANYLDLLADHSFGNFRELLEAITYSTAMGDWLTYTGSRKADASGRRPDENFARELMQLFTIGLHKLNDDGSVIPASTGEPLASYSQADITELARVFTGLVPVDPDYRNRDRNRKRLVIDPGGNDTGPKVVLGQSIIGAGEDAIANALDILVAHPNTGPYIGRLLIQRLVTSNPSRGYVQRVAAAFANNGKGERGDLKAVLRAILLDTEARSAPTAQSGKLRDPAQRLLNWARAFDVGPDAGTLKGPYLHASLIKSPGWSPTVFNVFDADYSPPLTPIQEQGLLAPEFQIASEQTVIEYISFMENVVYGNWASRGLEPKFDRYIDLAAKPADLVDRLNLVLAAGQLSQAIVNEITNGVAAIPDTDRNTSEKRIKFATLMVLASPDYLVLI